MGDIKALVQRHAAFWNHQDLSEPLVRVQTSRERERFENVDVTPELLDVEALTPEVGKRNWRKHLVQGDMFHTEHAYPRIPWMEAIVGCEIRAGADEAMWPKPALGPHYEGMERIVPGDDNPWLVKLLALTRALVKANDGSYLVTHTLMRGPIDLLSALIGDVRGLGLMLGVELVKDRERKTKAIEERDRLVDACFNKGLLLLGCGENSGRFIPGLTVSQKEIDRAMGIFHETLMEIGA